MKNKTLMITIMILMALASSVPFWLDAISTSENNNLLYSAVFFGLTGIAYICSYGFLIAEVKKINDKIWLPLLIITTTGGYILAAKFTGAFARTEYKITAIFAEPIMWMLIATLIGHLFLFYYKRNKNNRTKHSIREYRPKR